MDVKKKTYSRRMKGFFKKESCVRKAIDIDWLALLNIFLRKKFQKASEGSTGGFGRHWKVQKLLAFKKQK